MNGGIIQSDNTFVPIYRFQIGFRAISNHNQCQILMCDDAARPAMQNYEGYNCYQSPNPDIEATAYVSGSYGSRIIICSQYANYSTHDTGNVTMGFDMRNYTVEAWRDGTQLFKYKPGLEKWVGKNIRTFFQNYWSGPSGTAYFYDGSPGSEIPIPIQGYPTLYNLMNYPSRYKIYDETKNLFKLKP